MIQRVAGIDGCKGGWLVVGWRDGEAPRTDVCLTFREALDVTIDCDAVAVDMPIGLSRTGQRKADAAARRLIGPRKSSVFTPPARALVEAPGDYAALNAISKGIFAGLSRQTFGLLPRIREVDALLTPAMQDRVFESHPEVNFRMLKGATLAYPKRTADGAAERLSLLKRVFGECVTALKPPRGAAQDDLYDALALAWTAGRAARGEAVRLPEEPERDERGLRMEIVY